MDFELSRFLPYRMNVLSERLSQGLANRYRKEFGISVAEWRVLSHLSQADQVSIRDIQQRVNLEKSKVSRAASRLEQAGLIKKRVDTNDRRLLQLSLTENGLALMAKIIPVALAYQSRLETLLGDRLEDLDAALARLMEEEI